MINCQNLSYSAGSKQLLNNLSWQFKSQQISALVGANGAGKSTFLKLMLGMVEADSGVVEFHGHPIDEWCVEDLAKTRAYMAQSGFIRFSLPVYEYLALARLHWKENQKQCDYFVNLVIQKLGIFDLACKPIDQLSGGEFQRIELARAWCQLISESGFENTILLLDEPASALDIHQSQKLYQNLHHFVELGGTVIVVEHDINLAARFCDQMLLLQNGQCIASGDINVAFTQHNINQCFDVSGHLLTNRSSNTLTFSL